MSLTANMKATSFLMSEKLLVFLELKEIRQLVGKQAQNKHHLPTIVANIQQYLFVYWARGMYVPSTQTVSWSYYSKVLYPVFSVLMYRQLRRPSPAFPWVYSSCHGNTLQSHRPKYTKMRIISWEDVEEGIPYCTLLLLVGWFVSSGNRK